MKGFQLGRIHPSCMVSDQASIGAGVTIGARSIVYDNAEIGDEAVIGPDVIVGEPTAAYYETDRYENAPVRLGARSLVRSGSVLYAGSTLGDHFECGHHVTIREGAEVGPHCRIGTLSDIQGHCRLGEYTRLHSSVHIAQGSLIGSYVWLFPFVVLTNDPHPPSEHRAGVAIDDFAVVCAGAVLLPGVRVGEGGLIAANAVVREDVPAMTIVAGRPAAKVGDVRLLRANETGMPVYPWPRHFDRGMPWEGVGFDEWNQARSRRES